MESTASSPCSPFEDDFLDRGTSKKRSPSLPEKSCKVCGDHAVGHNFSVITCESCKAFFRRNARREQVLKCPFNQNCTINPLSRRFCQACRLQRCFQVGMKKEWIMREGHRIRKHRLAALPEGDEEIKKMLEQIEEGDVMVSKQVLVELVKKSNIRNLTACNCKCTCGFYPPETRLIAAPSFEGHGLPPAGEIMTSSDQVNHQYVHARQDTCSLEERTGYTLAIPDSLTTTPQRPVLTLPESGILWNDHMCSTTTRMIQQVFTSDAEHRAENAFQRLPADDKLLLQELVIANDILKQPLDLSVNQRDCFGDLSLMDVVRMTDLALRRIINMAKQLKFFKNLSNNDQIAILKGSCSELLILRGVMVFDVSKRAWNANVAQGPSELEIKLDVLKRSKEVEHYEEHKKFLTTFGEKWCKNEYIMLLLNAITLFSPHRANLRDTQKLEKMRQRYCSILKRYLDNLYVTDEAEKAYRELLQKLNEELTHLSQSLLRIYHGLNTSEVDPLLLELFDLSQHD